MGTSHIFLNNVSMWDGTMEAVVEWGLKAKTLHKN